MDQMQFLICVLQMRKRVDLTSHLLMKWIKHVSLGWFIQCKMAIIANLVFKWNGYIKLIFGYFTQCRVTMFKYQVRLGDTWHDTAKTGDQGVTLAPGHQWHHQHWSQMSQTLAHEIFIFTPNIMLELQLAIWCWAKLITWQWQSEWNKVLFLFISYLLYSYISLLPLIKYKLIIYHWLYKIYQIK